MKKSIAQKILRIIEFLLVTVICLVLVLLAVIWVLEKGPSKTVTTSFCKSVRETSALRWVPNIFLTDEEIESFKSTDTSNDETNQIDTGLISVSSVNLNSNEPDIQIIDISSGTCKGKLMIVKDPKRIILGTNDQFAYKAGLVLTDMVKKYNGIAGINAGGFNDENGQGDGSKPTGLVITSGELSWGSYNHDYNVVGFDKNGILIVGKMSGQQAIDIGMEWGVSFKTHDGLASALIVNGEVQEQNLSGGVNPRTAIGQRADGAVLMLVLDGRSINTLGATMEDVVNIMLDYGAVNAGNLDGGSSSVMVYENEIINNCASVTGPRRIPTGFIVLEEGDSVG